MATYMSSLLGPEAEQPTLIDLIDRIFEEEQGKIYFFELMSECSDKNAMEKAGHITSKAINQIFLIQDLEPEVLDKLHNILRRCFDQLKDRNFQK